MDAHHIVQPMRAALAADRASSSACVLLSLSMTRTVPFEDMLAYHMYHMEYKSALVSTLSHSTGRVVRTAKVIDLAGLGRAHLDSRGLAYLKRLLAVSQSHYPEMLGALWIVNAPFMFTMGWGIVKPWLHEHTVEKISILSAEESTRVLLRCIHADTLPSFLGGNCTCADLGGCVPQIDADDGMTTVTIEARGTYEHVLAVDQQKFDELRKAAENDAKDAAKSAESDVNAATVIHTSTPASSESASAAPSVTLSAPPGASPALAFRGVRVSYGCECRAERGVRDAPLRLARGGHHGELPPREADGDHAAVGQHGLVLHREGAALPR
jgi:hypothetical protein